MKRDKIMKVALKDQPPFFPSAPVQGRLHGLSVRSNFLAVVLEQMMRHDPRATKRPNGRSLKDDHWANHLLYLFIY